MTKLAICFGQFGPYHHARVRALQDLLASEQHEVIAVQIASKTATYSWDANPFQQLSNNVGVERTKLYFNYDHPQARHLITLCEGIEEQTSFFQVFWRARSFFKASKVRYAYLPSYSPSRYFALFIAAKSLGIRTIMMNDSHAHTEKATGWKKFIKKLIVRNFNSALVAGKPHKRHFHNLGIASNRIFTGYDVVNNHFFNEQSKHVRNHSASYRKAYQLPQRYFLSLGRLVEKKNLLFLLNTYADLVLNSPSGSVPALVFVGDGELENSLKTLASNRGLRVLCFDDRPLVTETECNDTFNITNEACVYFYGYRQINENGIFYGLAEAFILPSLQEEWGLVVNEAMACGLPILLSQVVGCVEDLLPASNEDQSMINSISIPQTENNHGERRINGFTFNSRSSLSLSDALRQFLNLSIKEKFELGNESLRIINQFSCETFALQARLAFIAAQS
jgi:glycosyltransferase involved in cell wall biosynthesis